MTPQGVYNKCYKRIPVCFKKSYRLVNRSIFNSVNTASTGEERELVWAGPLRVVLRLESYIHTGKKPTRQLRAEKCYDFDKTGMQRIRAGKGGGGKGE
jgi:hypothetical protein